MAGKRPQRLCRICKKRPTWKYKNCPPDVCKRCYHKHVWPERPAARKDQPDGESGLEHLSFEDEP